MAGYLHRILFKQMVLGKIATGEMFAMIQSFSHRVAM
jgi:hypothetical protein